MVRFVVVGTQRTGTTLIRTSLASHPRIRCEGEVFLTGSRKTKPYPGELGFNAYLSQSFHRKLGHYLWRGRTVRQYLDNLYSLSGYDAIGFKVMYSQVRFWRYPMVIPFIKEHQVRVIHVVRDNALKTLVSRVTAAARSLYHSTNAVSTRKVTLSIGDLQYKLREICRESTFWETTFRDIVPYLRITYESFSGNRELEEQRMLAFLDMDYAPLSSSLVKINPDDMSQLIENYDKVCEHLKNTAYARYLA